MPNSNRTWLRWLTLLCLSLVGLATACGDQAAEDSAVDELAAMAVPKLTKADFYTVNCNEDQVRDLQIAADQALAFVNQPKEAWQYERWFGIYYTPQIVELENYVSRYIIESLGKPNLGAAAIAALGLNTTSALPLTMDCNGPFNRISAHYGGPGMFVLDKPFWSDEEGWASYDSRAGVIIHEIIHLALSRDELPNPEEASWYNIAFDAAVRGDLQVIASAYNWEFFYTRE